MLLFGDQLVEPGGRHHAAWRPRSAWRTAQRRKQRLRSWWRHEQQSVAMALSAAAHHSYDYGLRAQKTDRAGAAHNAPWRQTQRGAWGPELFQLFEEEPGGLWPVSVPDPCRGAPRSLHHPVLPGWFFVSHRRRNSSWKCRPSSTSLSRKLTFQFLVVVLLVEVHKVFSQDRVRRLRLWSRSFTHGVLQGFLPRRGTLKRTAQIADIPVPSGLRHDFLPDPHPSARPADLLGEPNRWVFRTFPSVEKKCDNTCSFEVAGARALELIHAGCS